MHAALKQRKWQEAEQTHHHAFFMSSSSTVGTSLYDFFRCAPISCASLSPTPIIHRAASGLDEPRRYIDAS